MIAVKKIIEIKHGNYYLKYNLDIIEFTIICHIEENHNFTIIKKYYHNHNFTQRLFLNQYYQISIFIIQELIIILEFNVELYGIK